jgi:hypothetical protein
LTDHLHKTSKGKFVDTSGTIHLFSYFHNPDGFDGLRLAYSHDILNWKDIPGEFFRPVFGEDSKKTTPQHQVFRDPFIAMDPQPGGGFHMVWTTGWHSQDIGYAHSADLINWTDARSVPVMYDRPADNCWAPKTYYIEEDRTWLIIWSTTLTDDTFPPPTTPFTTANHRVWCVTTRDFRTFSKAKPFFDPGYSVIDAALLRDGGRNYLFFKDSRYNKSTEEQPQHCNIRIAESDSPYGPWGNIGEPITGYGPGKWLNEGPAPIKVDGLYYCFYDHYRRDPNQYYGATRSHDLRTWQDISHLVRMPEASRHGHMFEVPKVVLTALLQRY